MQRPRSELVVVPERRLQTSARSVLFSILAELVYREGRPVWTSSLLAVLTGLGISEEAGRQAIARAAAAGWIAGERLGRETRWTLTAETRAVFDAGSARVFAFTEPPTAWDGDWLVLVISVPHAQRQARKRLYSSLSWAGLGNPAPGLWVTPHTERAAEVDRVITELGLREFALATVGEIGRIGLDLDEIVARAWDLAGVAQSYGALVEHFTHLSPADGDPTLFALVELTDALRRLPFIDPQLPEELHPQWIGRAAVVRLRALRAAWEEPAHRRWREIVRAGEPRAPRGR